MFTAKFGYINTDTIIEQKTFETFKEVCNIIHNSSTLHNQLDTTKSLTLYYKDVFLFSCNSAELVYELDFKYLVNKIDFSLLSFNPFLVLLQKFYLQKEDFNSSFLLFHDTKIPEIAMIKFKDGLSCSIDDLSFDGFTDVEPNIRLLNQKIRIDLMNNDRVIVKTYEYNFEDIEKTVLLQFISGMAFEICYDNL